MTTGRAWRQVPINETEAQDAMAAESAGVAYITPFLLGSQPVCCILCVQLLSGFMSMKLSTPSEPCRPAVQSGEFGNSRRLPSRKVRLQGTISLSSKRAERSEHRNATAKIRRFQATSLDGPVLRGSQPFLYVILYVQRSPKDVLLA